MLEGKIIGIVGLIGDITERVRLEKQAQNWAVHDELTGLYNRNYLKVKGAEQLKGAVMPVTIIMGDCNYLKRVNDAYGHEYGDLLLKRVGRVIRENLPPESVALRMGGDEFLIACSHFSAEEAEQPTGICTGTSAKTAENPDEITASARSPRAEAVLVICYIRAVSTSAQSGKTPSAAAYRITFLMSRETLPSGSWRNSSSESEFSSSVGILTSMPVAV